MKDPAFRNCNVCGRGLVREDEFAAGMCAVCANEEMPPPKPKRRNKVRPQPHLAVEVRVDGKCVICLETNSMCGVNEIHKYEKEIRTAIEWLKGFIGSDQRPG